MISRNPARLVGLGLNMAEIKELSAMAEQRHSSKGPATIAVVVAVVCVVLLVLLVRDRWNRPQVRPPAAAQSTTTGQSARSAGAKVLPTDPKLSVEPAPAGPKPAQPANPD